MVTPVTTRPLPRGSRRHSFSSCTMMLLLKLTGTSLNEATKTLGRDLAKGDLLPRPASSAARGWHVAHPLEAEAVHPRLVLAGGLVRRHAVEAQLDRLRSSDGAVPRGDSSHCVASDARIGARIQMTPPQPIHNSLAYRSQAGSRRRLREPARTALPSWKAEGNAMLQDVRFAARLLWKDRTFTATALLTLALCIGGNVAMFTVVQLGCCCAPCPCPTRTASCCSTAPTPPPRAPARTRGEPPRSPTTWNACASWATSSRNWRSTTTSDSASAARGARSASSAGGSPRPSCGWPASPPADRTRLHGRGRRARATSTRCSSATLCGSACTPATRPPSDATCASTAGPTRSSG